MKVKKMQKGGDLGMKSVKAGYDKNPGVTRADIIVAAKKEAKYGKKMVKKAKSGASLKAVPADKQKSLGKLPTAVRNKMGFQKSGGKTKAAMKSGGKMGKCKYGCK